MFRDRLRRFHTACLSSVAYRWSWLFGALSITLAISTTVYGVTGWQAHGDPMWYVTLPGDDWNFLPIRILFANIACQISAVAAFTLWLAPSEDRTELLIEGLHPDSRGD